MLTSISPLGERARGNRWSVTVAAYVVASVLGGLTTGALLGLAGTRLHLSAFVAAAACAIAAVLDVVRRVPSLHRQVDEDWLTRYRGWVYGVGFGYQLGLGFVTIVTSAATYAVLALCLLSGSLVDALAIGACFGLVRAMPILLLRGARTPDALRATAARLERLSAGAGRATAVVLTAVAVTLAVTA